MATRRMGAAVAALALLTTPVTAFLIGPPSHRAGAALAVQNRMSQRQPLQPRTLHAATRMGMREEFGGDSGFVLGGAGAGASKFPVPGSDERWLSLSRVCVLLFNPRTENEGIYTLQLRVRGGYLNTVVLFEEQEDAERYAGLLEAQDFPAPQVEALDPREIAAFTADAGYKTSFIPAGTLFLPPEDNVDPADRPWRPDKEVAGKEAALAQMLADEEDSGEVDYAVERARLEALFGGGAGGIP